MTFNPRKNALKILNRLEVRGKTLDALLDEVHHAHPRSSRRDRALMQALVFGVLRWRARIDGAIEQYSNIGLRKIEPGILNVLRIGVFQIAFMDRIPVSAAVNTSVQMAKSVSGPWTVRFVNAILRKASVGKLPEPSGDAEEKSMPRWLLSRWTKRYGKTIALDMCDAVNRIPPITIRANLLKTSRESLLVSLSELVDDIAATRYSPAGISFSNPKIPIADMPAFKRGEFTVQDQAAQLIGHILSPEQGENVLDACAGLGGKTGHAGQLMHDHGRLYAMDKDPEKLKRLGTEMHRQGISIVKTLRHDLSEPLPSDMASRFDRVLIDAPCSGLGVMRRNPDTKWSVLAKDLHRLQNMQFRFLKHLAPLVKPSGIIVFVVCSTEPEENESVIHGFLKEHPDFQCDPLQESQYIPEGCITDEGFFRTHPGALFMDGFFAARLRRCFKETSG